MTTFTTVLILLALYAALPLIVIGAGVVLGASLLDAMWPGGLWS